MDGKTIQCFQKPRSMYLSIFNSFRVIWCLSQCVSPKNRYFYHILFLLGTPLGLSRKTLHKWKDNWVLAKRLAACTHLVSQLFEPQVQKIAVFTYLSPHFGFPWKRPWGNHAKCYMDGKRIRCLQIASPMCPSNYNRFSDRARYWSKIVIFSYPLAFDAPVRGFPSD